MHFRAVLSHFPHDAMQAMVRHLPALASDTRSHGIDWRGLLTGDVIHSCQLRAEAAVCRHYITTAPIGTADSVGAETEKPPTLSVPVFGKTGKSRPVFRSGALGKV